MEQRPSSQLLISSLKK